MFLNYILNYNLTSLVLVQYSFNFSLDIFEIPFIYAVFTSFRRFYLFNFKFKKVHVFVGDQTPTEQFCLRNFFYTIKFTCFSPSFLSLLSRQMIYYCDMKHITVSFSDTRKILQARFSVCDT